MNVQGVKKVSKNNIESNVKISKCTTILVSLYAKYCVKPQVWVTATETVRWILLCLLCKPINGGLGELIHSEVLTVSKYHR